METRLDSGAARRRIVAGAQPAARQVHGDLAHFGVEGTLLSEQQRAALPALFVRAEGPEESGSEDEESGSEEAEPATAWRVNPQALRHIREEAGSPHVLLVRSTDPEAMPRQHVSSGLSFSVSASGVTVPVSDITRSIRGGGQLERVYQTEMELFDAASGRALWRGVRPVTRSVVRQAGAGRAANLRVVTLQMLTGRPLRAADLFPSGQGDYVTVYLFEGARAHGTFAGVDGLDFVLQDDDDGESFAVPVETVSRVKSTQQRRFIFPVPHN